MKFLKNNLKSLSRSGFITEDQYNFHIEYYKDFIYVRRSLRKLRYDPIYNFSQRKKKVSEKNKYRQELIVQKQDFLELQNKELNDDDDLPCEEIALQLALEREQEKQSLKRDSESESLYTKSSISSQSSYITDKGFVVKDNSFRYIVKQNAVINQDNLVFSDEELRMDDSSNDDVINISNQTLNVPD